MPVSLTALLAAAIFEERVAGSSRRTGEGAVELLAHAVGGRAVSIESAEDELLVNGESIPLTAPGATLLNHALGAHDTQRLRLPPGLTVLQWRAVVGTYASPAGRFASIDALRDALRVDVVDVMVSSTRGTTADTEIRAALFELPGLRATAVPSSSATRPADARTAELAGMIGRLDPLLAEAASAADASDFRGLAAIVLQIHDLETAIPEDLRAIVVRERRRVVPSSVLDQLARAMPGAGHASRIEQALVVLGNDGVVALIGALAGAEGPADRRVYREALAARGDSDDAIVAALNGSRWQLARDAADLSGRKRLTAAVPMLTQLLKHQHPEVRTASWHALELIGTREAVRALRT